MLSYLHLVLTDKEMVEKPDVSVFVPEVCRKDLRHTQLYPTLWLGKFDAWQTVAKFQFWVEADSL